MALFLKCQERVKNSEDEYKKRTESIRVMESDDPALSAEDKRLFAETLREVLYNVVRITGLLRRLYLSHLQVNL